jgi:hypothetical protein
MINRNDLSQYEKNLISFLRLFQNRPFHLAKYFLENNTFTDEFKKHLEHSVKLSKISEDYQFSEIPTVYFLNFKEMIKFFETLSNDFDMESKDSESIQNELNAKLDDLIKQEKYEDAIKIRDYMVRNNIKRKS